MYIHISIYIYIYTYTQIDDLFKFKVVPFSKSFFFYVFNLTYYSISLLP